MRTMLLALVVAVAAAGCMTADVTPCQPDVLRYGSQ